MWCRNDLHIIFSLSDCQDRQGFLGFPSVLESSKYPGIYHRPTSNSFSAAAKMSLDVFMRSGGVCTVKFFFLPDHVTQIKSLCWLEHARKLGQRAGKSGGFGGVGVTQPLQGTPKPNHQLIGGLSRLSKACNFQTFALGKKESMGGKVT